MKLNVNDSQELADAISKALLKNPNVKGVTAIGTSPLSLLTVTTKRLTIYIRIEKPTPYDPDGDFDGSDFYHPCGNLKNEAPHPNAQVEKYHKMMAHTWIYDVLESTFDNVGICVHDNEYGLPIEFTDRLDLYTENNLLFPVHCNWAK